MATNPPITIGPFANVPAPGSGVKSDWAQQISTYVAPTVWTAVTFQNAWVNFGGGEQPMQYRKIGDMVQLRGVIKSGALNTVAFTLPAGFRPPLQLHLASGGGAYTDIIVAATGTVSPSVGNTAVMWVNCEFSVTP